MKQKISKIWVSIRKIFIFIILAVFLLGALSGSINYETYQKWTAEQSQIDNIVTSNLNVQFPYKEMGTDEDLIQCCQQASTSLHKAADALAESSYRSYDNRYHFLERVLKRLGWYFSRQVNGLEHGKSINWVAMNRLQELYQKLVDSWDDMEACKNCANELGQYLTYLGM